MVKAFDGTKAPAGSSRRRISPEVRDFPPPLAVNTTLATTMNYAQAAQQTSVTNKPGILILPQVANGNPEVGPSSEVTEASMATTVATTTTNGVESPENVIVSNR